MVIIVWRLYYGRRTLIMQSARQGLGESIIERYKPAQTLLRNELEL